MPRASLSVGSVSTMEGVGNIKSGLAGIRVYAFRESGARIYTVSRLRLGELRVYIILSGGACTVAVHTA